MDFINMHKPAGIWGNGAAFDNTILAAWFKHFNLPWDFRKDRCYRTVKNMFPGVPYQFVGTKHNALADATNQAEHLIQIAKGSNIVLK
jgi:inhibitor of KinA sporulation pathway (predicted exonuclease)